MARRLLQNTLRTYNSVVLSAEERTALRETQGPSPAQYIPDNKPVIKGDFIWYHAPDVIGVVGSAIGDIDFSTAQEPIYETSHQRNVNEFFKKLLSARGGSLVIDPEHYRIEFEGVSIEAYVDSFKEMEGLIDLIKENPVTHVFRASVNTGYERVVAFSKNKPLVSRPDGQNWEGKRFVYSPRHMIQVREEVGRPKGKAEEGGFLVRMSTGEQPQL